MPSKHLKFWLLFLAALIFFACAHQEPLQLPPSIVGDNPDSGWKSY